MTPQRAPSLTERLAARLVAPVDAATRARARLHLLDWLGCVAGGLRDGRRLLGSGRGFIDGAALLGNALEMDDVHRAAILHPGPVVWPAALQAALHAEADMGALLDAGVRGYEAMIGIGASLDARHYAWFHNTATAGGFGAAAAVWSLGRSSDDPAPLADALGLAGSVTGGLWQLRNESSDAKAFHILHAVHSGSRAASEALRGLRGPRAILEGPQGLYGATCTAPRPERLRARHWRIHDVSFKPWAACRHAHPAIDAALALRARGVTGEAGVLVETYADALTFCDKPDPQTVMEAKFSLQHAVAVALRRGEPRCEDFEPAAIADPALARLRAQVTVRECAEFSARFPDHFGARVASGAESATLIDTLGDPERPLGRSGIEIKARELMAWGRVADDADAVVAAVFETPDDAVFDIAATLISWIDA